MLPKSHMGEYVLVAEIWKPGIDLGLGPQCIGYQGDRESYTSLIAKNLKSQTKGDVSFWGRLSPGFRAHCRKKAYEFWGIAESKLSFTTCQIPNAHGLVVEENDLDNLEERLVEFESIINGALPEGRSFCYNLTPVARRVIEAQAKSTETASDN
jgi:hypothetical protein